MRVLVTGAAGFVGRHVVSVLQAAGHEPLPTDMRADPDAGIQSLDICSAKAVEDVVRTLQPDACIHLAGVAFVPDAAKHPLALNAINVEGPLNVAHAILRHVPRARLLFVSSAQVYGLKYRPEAMTESDPIHPVSPYAISKANAEAALLELANQHGLDIVIARPGNHTGPGQSPKFVAPAFIRAIIEYRNGQQAAIAVGNIESERDFSDVRDVVDAYMTLLQKGETKGIYNISANLHLQIGELLARIAKMRNVAPKIQVDPALYRPTDAMPALDTTRLRQLGWKPKYSFDRTLADLWDEAESNG